jgi:antitoxin component YwqK of YwqJK toxin-antitoxin module
MRKTLLLITSLVFLTTIAFSQSKVNIKSWWSKNVKIDSSGTNDNGKRDGLYTQWYENGQKKWEGTYKDGKIVEEWTFYYDYYENGQKKWEGTYKDGKLNGLSTEWHENGQKKKEGTYKDGKKDVLWTFWNKNGQKIREGTAKDGKPYGKWTYFNEDGSVKEVKEY